MEQEVGFFYWTFKGGKLNYKYVPTNINKKLSLQRRAMSKRKKNIFRVIDRNLRPFLKILLV